MTDTLPWTLKNKKIATIKADKGGYTATLKTLRQGETDIEVKSKITRKIVYLRIRTTEGMDENPVRAKLSIKKCEVERKALAYDDTGVEITLGKDDKKWYVFTVE